jgi:uncharacterized protein YoxC
MFVSVESTNFGGEKNIQSIESNEEIFDKMYAKFNSQNEDLRKEIKFTFNEIETLLKKDGLTQTDVLQKAVMFSEIKAKSEELVESRNELADKFKELLNSGSFNSSNLADKLNELLKFQVQSIKNDVQPKGEELTKLLLEKIHFFQHEESSETESNEESKDDEN